MPCLADPFALFRKAAAAESEPSVDGVRVRYYSNRVFVGESNGGRDDFISSWVLEKTDINGRSRLYSSSCRDSTPSPTCHYSIIREFFFTNSAGIQIA